MKLQAFPSGPFATNAYVAACPDTLQAAIVDPAPDSATAILSYLEENQLTPVAIIITHSHWDHIGDAAKLKNQCSIPVYIHSLDAANLQHPGSDGLPLFFHDIPGTTPDRLLHDGDEVAIGHLLFHVIHTPGHTPGGICLYNEKDATLLSGDTLFKGSIGNLSFPTAEPSKMWKSLEKLSSLPANTAVYPGHGPSTIIGDEPWLKNARELFEN